MDIMLLEIKILLSDFWYYLVPIQITYLLVLKKLLNDLLIWQHLYYVFLMVSKHTVTQNTPSLVFVFFFVYPFFLLLNYGENAK